MAFLLLIRPYLKGLKLETPNGALAPLRELIPGKPPPIPPKDSGNFGAIGDIGAIGDNGDIGDIGDNGDIGDANPPIPPNDDKPPKLLIPNGALIGEEKGDVKGDENGEPKPLNGEAPPKDDSGEPKLPMLGNPFELERPKGEKPEPKERLLG